MYTLPTEIIVDNDTLHIRERGDFRVILDCFSALQDSELDKEYRILTAMLIFYDDFESLDQLCAYPNLEKLMEKMFDFFACEEPQANTNKPSPHLINWETDAQLISSAINKVAGKEVRAESYIHWWTFMGYFNAIGVSTFATVMTIRKKIANGKKLEKQEREFKKENPQYFMIDFRDADTIAADEQFRKLWNKS